MCFSNVGLSVDLYHLLKLKTINIPHISWTVIFLFVILKTSIYNFSSMSIDWLIGSYIPQSVRKKNFALESKLPQQSIQTYILRIPGNHYHVLFYINKEGPNIRVFVYFLFSVSLIGSRGTKVRPQSRYTIHGTRKKNWFIYVKKISFIFPFIRDNLTELGLGQNFAVLINSSKKKTET